MKRNVITFVFLAVFFPVTVMAKQGEPKQDSKQTINRMAKDLGLNDDQKAQVETIFDEEKQTVETIFKEQDEKLKSAQEQTRNSLQQVLTPEQMEKLDKKMEQQSKKRAAKKH